MRGHTNLQHGVVSLKELDETRDYSAFNDTLNRWILLLRQELAELSSSIQLEIGVIGEDVRDQVLGQLRYH